MHQHSHNNTPANGSYYIKTIWGVGNSLIKLNYEIN